jgi:hypothetical protein
MPTPAALAWLPTQSEGQISAASFGEHALYFNSPPESTLGSPMDELWQFMYFLLGVSGCQLAYITPRES